MHMHILHPRHADVPACAGEAVDLDSITVIVINIIISSSSSSRSSNNTCSITIIDIMSQLAQERRLI